MERTLTTPKLRLLRSRVLRITLMGLLIGAGLAPARVEGRRLGSAGGISFAAGHDVGSSTENVHAVAVGDLDNDGDLDIVCGSGSSFEYAGVVAWENDGTPFTGLWPRHDVGMLGYGCLSVALGDLDNDGDLDIVSGSVSAYEIVAYKNDGTPFSGGWTQYAVSGTVRNTFSVALGDLDNDGDLDIASASSMPSGGSVDVWENDGTPFDVSWAGTQVVATTSYAMSVAVGDLDNDGDPDIVSGASTPAGGSLDTWENDGTPFSGAWAGGNVHLLDDVATSVALGDLDSDGDLDILSGYGSSVTSEVVASRNNGSPFSTGTWSYGPVGTSTDDVLSLALGDLDNDGDLDVVSGDIGDDHQVMAWQNDGTPWSGDWSQDRVGDTSAPVFAVALGDLDNDGDLDAVSGTGSAEDYEVIAWQNTSPHHRCMPFDCLSNDVGASSGNVNSVAVGDLDNDGDVDIVSGSGTFAGPHEVVAWQNDSSPFTGLWSQNQVGTSTAGVYCVAVGDLDNDGDLDVVSGSWYGEDYEVIAWQNDGTPFSGSWSQNDVGASVDGVQSVAVGDLDNDGDLDIVVGTSDSSEDYEVIAWENDGTPFSGLWSQNDVGASTDHVMSVALGDLDNDGDLDIVSGSLDDEDYEVTAWQNDGTPFTGLWSQQDVAYWYTGGLTRSVSIGDLDNDGDSDIVSVSSLVSNGIMWPWENDGTPFNGPWLCNAFTLIFGGFGDLTSVTLGDLDRDGDLDVISGMSASADHEVVAWDNHGAPFSIAWKQYDVGVSADDVSSVALADLDNDGDLDIVSGSEGGEDYEVIVWENAKMCAHVPLILKSYAP